MNTQNNKHRSEDNPTFLNTVTLNEIKFEMWCALIAIEEARRFQLSEEITPQGKLNNLGNIGR